MFTLGCFAPLLFFGLLFLGISSTTSVTAPSTAAVDAPPVAITVVAPTSQPAPPSNKPRILGIAVAPQTEPPASTKQDFIQRIIDGAEMAEKAGVRGTTISFKWSELEPAAGQFKLDDLVGGLRFWTGKYDFTVELSLALINTTTIETPPDLAGVTFDAPQMKERFHALIDALRPYLDEHVAYLSIGNEVDVYLGMHQAWKAYQAFYEDAVAYVHKVAPWIKVGVTSTADGVLRTYPAEVAALNKPSDVFIVTYYPLTEGFDVRSPDAPLADFPRLLAASAGRPLVLQEVGYPASPLLKSSEQKQAEFVSTR